MSLTDFHYDILSDIASFLPTADASRLSRTSKMFNDVATRQMLNVVRIHSAQYLQAFWAYASADIPGRLCWVRELRFDKELNWMTYKTYTAINALLDLLEHLQPFRLLRLALATPWESSSSFHWPYRLGEAIAALPHLVELDLVFHFVIRERQVLWAILFCSLRSTPRTLAISAGADVDAPILFCNLLNLEGVEDMSLSRFDIDAADEQYAKLTWPSVRTLRLTAFRAPLSLLGQMFPNVRELHLRGYLNYVRGKTGRGWPDLQRVVTTDTDVHKIVKQKVHWLDIERSLSGIYDREYFQGFGLDVLQPTVLTLRDVPTTTADTYYYYILASLLSGSSIKLLEIYVRHGNFNHILDLAEHTLSYLSRVRLVGIKVLLCPNSDPHAPWSSYGNRAVDDLSRAALSLAENIPALNYLSFGTCSTHRAEDAEYKEVGWKVRRHEEDVSLDLLRKADAEVLFARMHDPEYDIASI